MVTSSEVIPRAPNTICWRRLWCIGPSQISQTSLASRSLYFARILARCGDPASSSPSKTNLTLGQPTVTNSDPNPINTVLLGYATSALCYSPGDFTGQAWHDNVIAVDPVDPM